MKNVLLINFLCWGAVGVGMMIQNEDGYFLRLLGGMMSFGFYLVIDLLEKKI